MEPSPQQLEGQRPLSVHDSGHATGSLVAPETQNRRKHPCLLCQQRKVKCDRNDPCANCVKSRAQCISTSTVPPKRRKKRFPEAELLARLRRYEEHLKRYGADIDAINREDAPIFPKTTLPPGPLSTDHYDLPDVANLSIRRSLKHLDRDIYLLDEMYVYTNAFQFRDAEEILRGSSDDEDFQTPITKTYDAMCHDGGDLLFNTEVVQNLTGLHPSPVHIFRLWQSFLDNVNPLIKIFHAPTVQQQILDASGDLDNVSKPTQVLMFGVYCMAVTSIDEPDCLAIFGEEKNILLERYQAGARQALIRASFLRSSDLTILQGFTLYLLSCLNFMVDPRALFCLTGIAVRIAHRIGLDCDGVTFALSPFEIEMRRRLWWQIVFLDNRVSELAGSGPSIFQNSWTTKVPLNVNDTDLFPDMREAPVEHPGITEMLFVIQRCEAADFLIQSKKNTGLRIADTAMIDAFENRMQEKYFKYCDPQIPLHMISTLFGKIELVKLRAWNRNPNFFPMRGLAMNEDEKERLFWLNLSMLDTHNKLSFAPSLQKFRWHIFKNFPFLSHAHILCELRTRTTGEGPDKAWAILEKTFTRFDQHRRDFNSGAAGGSTSSLIQLAMANVAVKAWEAREAALLLFQPNFQTPQFIVTMKEKLTARKSPKSTPTQSDSSPSADMNWIDDQFGQIGTSHVWMNQAPLEYGQTTEPVSMPMPGIMQTEDTMNWNFWNNYM
ncbi:hypothetical protein G7Y89_g6497 [Cudoniella acicularis]|uniref:Zn(2)-C6 fungal-type domain-containing protein n=1 Tax=Cudoniella acicularis TaxID=354080 RepID=A0A8H4W2Y4_9HELO|nr:hypothetical protein G7Y89_g6497 [Cudoniella acicularis]